MHLGISIGNNKRDARLVNAGVLCPCSLKEARLALTYSCRVGTSDSVKSLVMIPILKAFISTSRCEVYLLRHL